MPICIAIIEFESRRCYVACMSKRQIRQLIENNVKDDGLFETGIKGVQLFCITEPHQCAPAVYEPTVVAILNGAKEAIVNGKRYTYGDDQYLCCPIPMPVEAGTPTASPNSPLLGVYISLDTTMMTDLAFKMDSAPATLHRTSSGPPPQSFSLAQWDDTFSDALLRLLQLNEHPADIDVLADSRLRELYYAVLKGAAGDSARRAFGIGNEIARAIQYLATHLSETVTIEEIAAQAGMSRAVFHRKFKQTTTLSPIQFVKSMRLNKAAMMIAAGASVSVAAMDVGYVSSSQFSREFKRVYGKSPKAWRDVSSLPAGMTS